MATFIGSNQEFKRYIGPLLRNLVQQLSRKYKTDIGCCQKCGAIRGLEAAHIHGRERSVIIDEIIGDHANENTISIDLVEFEQYFKDKHEGINEVIIVLCKKCHTDYDAPATLSNVASDLRVESNVEKEATAVTFNKRLFSNKEIQQRISDVAKGMPSSDLKALCEKVNSKETFNIDFPLFIKVPIAISSENKKNAVKDEHDRNRWTWKYEFEKEGFLYGVTTQWYPRHDQKVQAWLKKYA